MIIYSVNQAEPSWTKLTRPHIFNTDWLPSLKPILLVRGVISRSNGLDFIHSWVEVLDILWRVQPRWIIVLVSHHFGAETTERQGAPVVGRAYVFHLLQKPSCQS